MDFTYEQHPDADVQRAIIRLCNSLCQWERSTGRTSVLIVREAGGFVFRAASGKPVPASNNDVPDRQLVTIEAPDTAARVPVR
jgi:hypothetical protein